MVELKDPVAKKCVEIKKGKMLNEDGENIYNIYRANAETVSICKANEKKKPKRISDDQEAYVEDLFGIR